MNIWKKLEETNIENKERYINLFREIIEKLKSNEFEFKDEEGEDYYIINEQKTGTKFVHIVPKELKELFDEMIAKTQDEFLGFTVLINNTRVSCFGVPCSELSKVIIGEKQ